MTMKAALTHENNFQVYQGRREYSELIFLKDFIKNQTFDQKAKKIHTDRKKGW